VTSSWRDNSKKRFKKPAAGFFDFADEETTFNVNEQQSQPARTDVPVTPPTPSELTVDPLSGAAYVEPNASTALQSGNKVAAEVATNLDQSSNKVTTNLDQSSNSALSTDSEKDAKVATQLTTEPRTKLKQSSNKVATNPSLEAITGLQRDALFFIYENCRYAGSKTSTPIAIKNLAEAIKCSVRTARVTIQRIEKKGYVTRLEYKDGRGGWTKYQLPNEIYSQLLFDRSSNKAATNLEQSGNKVAAQPTAEVATKGLSSSSSLSSSLEKELTATNLDLVGEWRSIQTPNALRSIGFGESQIRQICEAQKLTPEVVQSSLDHYAYDLSQGKKINSSPLGYIVSILKFRGEPYISSAYLKEEAREIAEYMAQVEKTRSAKEAMLQHQLETQFEEWFLKLSPTQMTEFVAPNQIATPGSQHYKRMLREYFTENIWNRAVPGEDLKGMGTQILKGLDGNA
jgi:DNA-binding MarR family transcriptional regulator